MKRTPLARFCGVLGTVVGAFLSSGCQPTALPPTSPSGYRLTVPEASQTLRMHPLPLTVRVQDAAGKPVDEVPVQFHLSDAWSGRAQLDPPTVVTRQGQATTTLRARTAGRLTVQVTVEDRTVTVPITVLGDSPRF
ncbi:MAG: Ig-like domain-containing protein [Candidatus Tectimicrobiota bacterium]